ncbi:TetR/AcrR family transcriptional regulator [Polymorphospora rubra]|uniref:TetR family transcriptional regulator n=1 Tax=Polymorphospora rubra TaxID=338584 RepID=A0A810N495_9ACTN|nr:TetR/AcrR family transcriptional regulator [Polymorphospora rubra]BCJ68206.1 TetR family transcriptional regulator [Polymorphospora rubra]
MTTEPSTYHRRMAEQKRAAIIEAATRLFLRSGYGGASLAKIAAEADVSKATLFKQFPTKAALFDAIVTEYWKMEDEQKLMPAVGDLRGGLTTIGGRYVALLTRPGMADLFRIVIAEASRFPELGRTQFELGKMPFFDSVCRYLRAEAAAGTVQLDDPELAATQFLGMISDYVFWPRMLLVNWAPGKAAMARVVEEAARTLQARYAVGPHGGH